MAKIDYFTNPKLANGYLNNFVGIKLSDIDFKNKYANKPIDEGFDKEYEKIKAEVLGGCDPIDDKLAGRFWRDGIQSGDSYIPMEIFEEG